MTALRETPLYERHQTLGARLVPFAGYSMPVQYTSILEEHAAAREAVALFDVSHMGQLHVEGSGSAALADRVCSRRMGDLAEGRVRYALLCNDAGGVVDDVTVYRTASDAFLFCVNAANIAKDRDWLESHAPSDARVRDASQDTALLALQGPHCVGGAGEARRRRPLGRAALPVRGIGGRRGAAAGVADGLHRRRRLRALRRGEACRGALGRPPGRRRSPRLRPSGLGARDTLRLEAALPLYGQELDDETTPFEAGLDRFVDLERDFLGAAALAEHRARGARRQLVGFAVQGRGIARSGYPILDADGQELGHVTSGAPSPTLGHPIGLGYVTPDRSAIGSPLSISVRSRQLDAEVVETPFVSGRTAGRPKPG